MRMQDRTGAVHRPRRPIIGSSGCASLPPRPTRLSVTGTPFLRLPRHPRPLPVSGSRPPEPRRRRRRHDALDRPGRPGAAHHGRARGPGALAPPQGSLALAAGGDRRLRRAHRPSARSRTRPVPSRRRASCPTSPCSRSEPPRSSTRAQRFADLAWFLVAFCTVAVAWGAVEFVVNGGKRQGSFMGEHDLAALSTHGARARARVPLRPRPAAADGRARRDRRRRGRDRPRRVAGERPRPLPRAVAMVALALVRRDLRRRAVVVTVLICAAVTAGTYGAAQRRPRLPPVLVRAAAGDAGAVRRELEPAADLRLHRRPRLPRPPGLRHRLVRASCRRTDYARYLADARERFSDQPPHYFPPATGTLIPQQTYDQVLFELGLVGAALFVVLVALADPRRGRRRPAAAPGDAVGRAGLPPAAAGSRSIAGAIAGAALFGGSPLAALFWLALGRRARGPSAGRAGRRMSGVSLSIVHVIARLNVGGAALHVLQLAARAVAARPRRRRRRGHAGRRARSRWSTSPTSSACRVLRLPALQRELSPRADPAAIRAAAPDHPAPAPGRPAHAHGEGRRHRPARRVSVGPRAARARSSTPTTATSSAATSAGAGSASSARIERGLALTSGTLIAVSEEVRDDLVALRRRAARERFVVVPYGFDLAARGARRTTRRGARCAPRSAPARTRSSSAGPAA